MKRAILASVLVLAALPAHSQTSLGVRETNEIVSDGRRGGGSRVKVIEVLMNDRGDLTKVTFPTRIPAGPETVPMRRDPLPGPISVANGAGDVKVGEIDVTDVKESAVLKRLLTGGGRSLGFRTGIEIVSDGRRGGARSVNVSSLLILRGDSLFEFVLETERVTEHVLSAEVREMFEGTKSLGIRESLHHVSDGRRGGGTTVYTVNVLVTDGRSIREIRIPQRPDGTSSLDVSRVTRTEAVADPISPKISQAAIVLGTREGSMAMSDGRRGGGVNLKTTDVMVLDHGQLREFSIPISSETLRIEDMKVVDQGAAKIQLRSCKSLF